MDWQERKSSLIQLMGASLEQVFPVLAEELSPDSPLFNEFIQQKSQFEDVRREERNGTISRSDKNLAHNRIRVSLLEIVGLMTETDFHAGLSANPAWLELIDTHQPTARKYWIPALAGAFAIVLIVVGFPFFRPAKTDPAKNVPAKDSVEFYGILTDRQDRLLGNATLLVGGEVVEVGPNGRFRQKLPFPEDTLLPLKILIGDSLVYSNDELIHSPYDKKLTNYP
jgi:hypothetical protein